MNNIIVETKNLSKRYKNMKRHVLKGIDLRVNKSEFVALVGPSGCGKTTLLNLIGALDSPTNGEIYVDGMLLNTVKNTARFRLQNIGFVFQNYYLLPSLNVLDNVVVQFASSLWTRRKYVKKAKELLESLGLKDKIRSNVSKLSGGERQRVAIARALVNDPKLILADEPTGNLDSENGMMVLDILQKLNAEQKTTIILVTHDINVKKFAPRSITMFDGVIVDRSS